MSAPAVDLILPFDSPAATLATAGGKGANLARLTRAGFPVPAGFILATAAYQAYVAANGLADVITAALAGRPADSAEALEQASGTIRGAFAAGRLPADLEAALTAAYARFGGGPVAVRSSATAEDLPELSFAGQQDTYLNVVGAAAVSAAVVNCWSSLWTARAIGYRERNGIAQAGAAVAVVVQALVPSEVAGVLFTANPLTGRLDETVIDATFGLGEALVSGQVEPDHFVVETHTRAVRERRRGAKQVATRTQAGGGVAAVAEPATERFTLTDAELLPLAEIGQRIQAEYGAPQDIEWAWAGGQFHILQARAITSLFPVPRVSFDPLLAWFSFGAVQGLVGPVTPLGQDGILQVAAGGGRLFGVTLRPEAFAVFAPAGERLWIHVTDVLRNPLGRRAMNGALDFIEPSIGEILRPLLADPRLGAGTGRLRPVTVFRLARFALPILARLVRNLLRPESARARFDADIEAYIAAVQVAPAADRFGRLANVVAFLRARVGTVFAFLIPRFIPIFGPAMGGLTALIHLSGDRNLALEVTRGLPRNVTTEMDLALWRTAGAIQADPASAEAFRTLAAEALAERCLAGQLPPPAQAAVTAFLERYGARGVGEIDFGQPRWREDPTPVMHSLQSYLQIPPEAAPDAVFARGEQAAQAAVEQIAAKVRREPGGWLKEKVVRAAARRIRLLMGARESPKFFAIRTMGLARSALLAVGREFAAAGTLARADDLVFLRLDELEALARNEARDWRALCVERRAVYQREVRRRQVPRVLLSDGRAFYDGLGAAAADGAGLSGSPVSPGVVEGRVHVVLDPRGTQLAPGEILVCPGTDPAWTPLFLAAGGLITEVGGMMTHGSVVAREYGLPAVVGVHAATTRLRTGQRIRVDGTAGLITLLPD